MLIQDRFFTLKISLVVVLLALSVNCYTFNNPYYNFVFWLDSEVFFLLNGSLQYNKYWAFFWGYLNHFNETYLNLIPVSLLLILLLKRAGCSFKECLFRIAYYFVTLQLVIYFHKHVYTFMRISPSYFYPDNFVSIVDLLNNQNLKWNSHHSFPSGHSLALFYFFFFVQSMRDHLMTKCSLFIAVFFSIPRLFGGAHWLSDILYSILLAYFFFLVFYKSGIEKRLNIFKN
jgi:membrane-associated phospholipid phosphatase